METQSTLPPTLEWLRWNCRRMFLRAMVIDLKIGVNDDERKVAQRVQFDIDVYVPLTKSAPQADRVEEIVEYNVMRRAVRAATAGDHVELQETVCDDILARLLSENDVVAARVQMQKLRIYRECDGVGVEAFRAKSVVMTT